MCQVHSLRPTRPHLFNRSQTFDFLHFCLPDEQTAIWTNTVNETLFQAKDWFQSSTMSECMSMNTNDLVDDADDIVEVLAVICTAQIILPALMFIFCSIPAFFYAAMGMLYIGLIHTVNFLCVVFASTISTLLFFLATLVICYLPLKSYVKTHQQYWDIPWKKEFATHLRFLFSLVNENVNSSTEICKMILDY